MTKRFAGKGFVVTGGTRGIGRAVVLAAASEGANVVFCGRPGSEEAGAEVVASAGKLGAASVFFVPADVSREVDVESLFDLALPLLGDRLNVVINNAGIQHSKLLVEMTLDEWNLVLAVNLRGPFLVCRRAVEELLAGGEGGRIVNVSSFTAGGLAGGAAYAASKSALLSLSRSVAKEYGRRGIACNAVVPGFVDTDLVASLAASERRDREALSLQRRFGRPDEIAEAVLFLASDQAAFVTGDALTVADGAREVPRFGTR